MASVPAVRLSDLASGAKGQVQEVLGHPAFRQRMLALGITPGSPLAVLRRLPFHGPVEIVVRGTRIAVRLRDAQQISVLLRR